MNYIKTITQQKLSLLLALYIGILLNLPIFYRRFDGFLTKSTVTNWLTAVTEVMAIVVLTFFLMRLLSLGGKRFYRVLATLLVVISVAAAYYMAFFNVMIGYGIVASVMTTDVDLSKEVVGLHFVVWMVAVSALPLLMIWRNNLSQTLIEQLRTPGQRLKPMLVMLLCVALVWLPIRYFDKLQKTNEEITNIDLPSYGGVVAHSYLPSNWLAALGLFAWTHIDETLDSQELLDPAKKFTYVAPPGIDDTYVVFVIGETTRWDHMGMLGYDRDTTPKLSKEKNLVAFRGESCDTSTKLSLRCMFVREGGTEDSPGRTLKEKNIFAVMKELGFSSELFAMQSEVWFYDNAEVDNFAFREQIGSEPRNAGKSVDDMLLVPELKASLDRYPHGKHLVVLHTKGSHYLYSQRYPRSFARYQPECMGVDETCSKAQLINAYDNSILYVDSMLDSVLDQLRDKKAIVFYAADHGESISENTHLHGTPREMAPPEQFRVPMMVWASDKYLADANNRANFERLQAQQRIGKTHRHVELFDTILGCLGYTSPNGGIKAANNWCQAPASSGASAL
ncbi:MULTISPECIES: kdo(2)-lipid A phosphoethanolamine 7''-transferase [Pantoea]|jgi:KDO II ethanolaminephosphotransferase|uniref:Kdo(2)-lipid A phosphoethanolamine 7''-transferase n=1 Tax=Pantoea piersonii TaxID=2364647 RepID=A0AAJ5U9Q8_9GAMM|nr:MULTISPECIES: kdo(2)-lipid A phosphoethanolamine 7''-transferase [Pantoea]MDU6434306.1 kdo(2)-lipid A phosphoethanolamine 7''-transferase [Pantoea sp.]MBZ6388807.1 kdo(2)-lipid A phosphoethanolamine 7''-transferase [Pantoea piersonii]MBZ6402662.1 kdo(2)-lipid A phosphoethanolamine 7''-transferase [Pantoea piersonii]MBZ6410776.1 kdo(2)-lipid A phosphoethanolamine 7''-transferase [Pantoea piersonii]MBZ6428248.1 kdo(2)-lipid A phosphoethanolamine 7''-transferase [Pantoea piersonii]